MGYTYRKYFINEDFFKSLTADSCYILGLILTDGSIQDSKPGKGPLLRISSINYDLLELVRNAMCSNHRIRPESNKNGTWFTLSIYSKEIVNDLMKLGFTENKSLTCKLPNYIPNKFLPDFLRGIFDGDGCVYKANRHDSYIHGIKVEIATGSIFIKESLTLLLNRLTSNTKGQFTIQKRSNSNVYNIRGNSTVAKLLYDFIYYSNCLCYKVKFDKFSKLIHERECYFNSI